MWLGHDKNRKIMSSYELQLLLDEINSGSGVGIRAGGIFTITYQLVANVSQIISLHYLLYLHFSGYNFLTDGGPCCDILYYLCSKGSKIELTLYG